MSILTFAICFFFYAFVCACLYDYLHRAAGSPRIDDDGVAVCDSGMIFSAYGIWLANRYNDWREHWRNALWKDAEKQMPTGDDLKKLIADYRPIVASRFRMDMQNVSDAAVAAFIHRNIADRLEASRNALNPYKPLGLCDLCTAFWFYTPLAVAGLWALSSCGVCVHLSCAIIAVVLFPSTAFTIHTRI